MRRSSAGTAIGHIAGFCEVLLACENSLVLKSWGNLRVNKTVPPGQRLAVRFLQPCLSSKGSTVPLVTEFKQMHFS